MSLPQIVLYDAHNLTHTDSHDLMGLWDIFVRPLSRHQRSEISDDCEAERKHSVKAERNQLLFFPRVLCYLSITHTAVYLSSPDRCHVLCRHLILTPIHL